MLKPLAALVIGLGLAGAGQGYSQDIYKWTDGQGQVHYSNHGGSPSDGDSSPPTQSSDQGWESALEKQQGRDDFQEKAEAAINSLELQMIRKKRDREHASEALEATQADIVRAQASRSTELPTLKAREATQITDLRKLDAEIGAIQVGIAKIRVLKAAEKEQRSSR
jgi:hypothetical protein